MRNAEVIRQWNILREIEASRRATIHGLARRTGVTTRTIRRDLEALQLAGFPLYDETIDGRRYWKLDTRPFRTFTETGLTLSELCALYFSRTMLECLAGTPFRAGLGTAFAKIDAVLTPRMRQFLDRLPRVLHAKPSPAKRRDGLGEHETLARLLDATLHQRQATLKYHSFSSRRTKIYLVHPYRLVYADGGFYVAAYVPEYGAMRTFAVERIHGLSVLEETFDRVLQEEELFSHSLGINQGPPERIELLFAPQAAPYVGERTWHPSQEVAPAPDGSLRLTLSVCNDWSLRAWILSFGPLVRVLAPDALARQIAGAHREAAGLYGH